MPTSFRRGLVKSHQSPTIDPLERRAYFTAVPTNFDQYMLQLINRGRANPTAEAAREGIALNEGLTAGTISTAAKQPLAFNPNLLQSSADYSTTLLGAYNYFDHYYNNTNPQGRMTAAGYVFIPNDTNGENIAVRDSTGPLPVDAAITSQEYDDLFIDSTVPSRGHRLNLMDGQFKEIGIGVVAGANYQGIDTPPDHTAFNAVLATQDFAASAANPNPFLTGVAFNDTVTADNFYTPGEGLGNVTVTATNTATHAVFSTTTWSTGGYSLAVPSGAYSVSFTGSAFAQPAVFSDVVGTSNVEQDAQPQNAFLSVVGGLLTINGTASTDTITLTDSAGNLTATLNGVSQSALASTVNKIQIIGGAGADNISVDSTVSLPCSLLGGKGPDTLVAGAGPETLIGGRGRDFLHGGTASDSLAGGKGADTLVGGAASDTLAGGRSANSLTGSAHADLFYAINNVRDTLIGGGGSDTAHADPFDSLTAITSIINT